MNGQHGTFSQADITSTMTLQRLRNTLDNLSNNDETYNVHNRNVVADEHNRC